MEGLNKDPYIRKQYNIKQAKHRSFTPIMKKH